MKRSTLQTCIRPGLVATAAFCTQEVLDSGSGLPWFIVTFLVAYAVDSLVLLASTSDNVVYVEDLLLGALVTAMVGSVGFLFDVVLTAYTARRAAPALPALVCALVYHATAKKKR